MVDCLVVVTYMIPCSDVTNSVMFYSEGSSDQGPFIVAGSHEDFGVLIMLYCEWCQPLIRESDDGLWRAKTPFY